MRATVLLPTTGDRGPLLEHSIPAVLSQTVADLELFVLGDGIDAQTRAVVERFVATDERVHLVEHPKHQRRGEPHRHAVLSDRASGTIVAYACDRDLWLPTHLEELEGVLRDADWGHTLRIGVGEDDRFELVHPHDLRSPAGRSSHAAPSRLAPLSFVGHRLDAYRRLPHGWRETPPGRATDRHMWAQFLDEPWVRVAASPMPTVLYFKRGGHPGLPTAERLALLERWSRRLVEVGPDAIQREALDALWRAWSEAAVRAEARAARPWARAGRVIGRWRAGR